MHRRLVLLLVSAAMMVAASISGHSLLRSIQTEGHIDRFAVAESHEHRSSESTIPELAAPIAAGSLALVIASRSKRWLPAAALWTPLVVISAQEVAEHGTALINLLPSLSLLLLVAIALTAGVLLVLSSKRIVRVAIAIFRRLRASATFVKMPAAHSEWRRRIAFARCAARGPPRAYALDAPRAPPIPARS